MKTIFLYFFIFFCVLSCKGQNDKSKDMDASKVVEITIKNKLFNPSQKMKPNLTIKDKDIILKIVEAFRYSEKIKGTVNTGANNGFFEIDFNEGNINHYYTINYTVYDGVILRNDHNGEMFKNDKLEGVIYPLFVQ